MNNDTVMVDKKATSSDNRLQLSAALMVVVAADFAGVGSDTCGWSGPTDSTTLTPLGLSWSIGGLGSGGWWPLGGGAWVRSYRGGGLGGAATRTVVDGGNIGWDSLGLRAGGPGRRGLRETSDGRRSGVAVGTGSRNCSESDHVVSSVVRHLLW